MLSLDHKIQNAIYRCIHDGVCPACGHDVVYSSNTKVINCTSCGFNVTQQEMTDFRLAVEAWGNESQFRVYVETRRRELELRREANNKG